MSSDSMGLPCSGAALVSMVHVCIETWIGIHATTANPRHTMPRDSDGDSSCRLLNSIGLCLFPLGMSDYHGLLVRKLVNCSTCASLCESELPELVVIHTRRHGASRRVFPLCGMIS